MISTTIVYKLSKSKIIAGLQCPKRLWLQTHKPEMAEQDEMDELGFSIGTNVGEIARTLYADGILVGDYDNLYASLARTKTLLTSRDDAVLFEAAFSANDILILADIVEKQGSSLMLIEVKSSTSTKNHHIKDAAVQSWVMESAGFKPAKVLIRHINNTFVYPGEGNYIGILTDDDVTDVVSAITKEVPKWIDNFQEVLNGKEPPIEVGNQCEDPYACEFYSYCARNLPPEPEYSVYILPRGGAKADELWQAGYRDLRDVPADILDKEMHLRVHEATLSGKPFLDPNVTGELSILSYPRYYIDFEGINFAIPIWAGTRPYQQIPFQFSCHIENQPGSLGHKAFLHADIKSPILSFTDALLNAVGTQGPIFVYNSAYEKTIIDQLAAMLPDRADRLYAVIERIVDLLPITRSSYYHPAMKGSWSIKAVLPTIAPNLSYDTLEEVADGIAAQNAFIEIISTGTTENRRKFLAEHLLAYCARDTLALVAIADYLEKGFVRTFQT